MTRTAPRAITLRKIGAALLLVALAACASPFKAEVTRFQTHMPAPAGQSFAVVAEDPALAGGIEFSHYAGYVDVQMRKLGYQPAASPESADLLVRLDYQVDNGRERINSYGGYGYGRFGYGGYPYRRFGYGGYGGFGGYGGYGGYDGVRSYTVYTSGVELKIDQTATGERVFEGKALTDATSNRLQNLVPKLVEALFVEFPGNSGEVLLIKLEPEGTKVKPAPSSSY